MFMHFEFTDGSNPYIATSTKAVWNMVKKYDLEQIGERRFIVHGKANRVFWTVKPGKITAREKNQVILRDFAILYSLAWGDFNYSYGDLADWDEFFTEYGRKYGLMREFHENAIC